MSSLHPRSLAHRMQAPLFRALTLLFVIFVVIYGMYAWQEARRTVQQELANLAELVARTSEASLHRFGDELELLSNMLRARDLYAQPDEAFKLLEAYRSTMHEVLGVTLRAPDGTLLVAAPENLITIRDPMQGKFGNDVSPTETRRVFVDRTMYFPDVDAWAIPLRHVVLDESGTPLFILTVNLSLNAQQSIWRDIALPERYAFVLLREDGYMQSRLPAPTNGMAFYNTPVVGPLARTIKEFPHLEHGFYEGTLASDQSHRMGAFQRLTQYQLVTGVAVPSSHVWEVWFRMVQLPFVLFVLLYLSGFFVARLLLKRQKETEAAFEESEARFQGLAENVPGMIFQWYARRSGETGLYYVSPRCEEIFGFTVAEALKDWQSILNIHPDDLERWTESIRRAVSGPSDWNYEGRRLLANGEIQWWRGISRPMPGKDGEIVFNGIMIDITERKRTEAQLRLAASVYENSGEAIMVTDEQNNFLMVNRSFTEITGYTPEEVIGQNPRMLSSSLQDDEFYDRMWRTISETGRWQGEIWNRRKSGELYPEWLSVSAVRDETGRVTNYIAIFSDITERKAAEERIHFLAHYDPLTRLPNRVLLQDRLEQSLVAARRHGQRVAVMFLDLDRFKAINDSLGHQVGDELLKEIGSRLGSCLRGEDTVARLGGDEFLIVLKGVQQAEEVAHVAEKVAEIISRPCHVRGYELNVSTSVGISLYPNDGEDVETLIRNADTAMYQAKAKGRNNFQFFTEDMNRFAVERLQIENDLRRALDHGELLVHYQPQYHIASRQLVGFEALVRWQHPTRGMIPPVAFIPVAEESGLIVAIGDWVMNEVCRQGKAWRDRGLGGITLAVNVSALQFRQRDFTRKVAEAIERSGFPAGQLELELTESILMHDTVAAIAEMEKLRAMGVKLSIDDFGTGFSSLSYLTQFPIDRIKIDRSFVNEAETSPKAAAIASAIIAMGKSLRLKVIAEGVETDEQLIRLQDAACDEAQGYLFARPLPAEEAERLFAGVWQAKGARDPRV